MIFKRADKQKEDQSLLDSSFKDTSLIYNPDFRAHNELYNSV